MINMLFSPAGKDYRAIAPLILRLVAGFGFAAHGWAKISRGLSGFEHLLAQLHVPFPAGMAAITAWTELLGGLALMVGLLVSVVSLPLICTMLVAMFTVQLPFGYSSVKTVGLTPQGPVFGPPGYEINLLYIAALVVLIVQGAGRFSVDAWIARKSAQHH